MNQNPPETRSSHGLCNSYFSSLLILLVVSKGFLILDVVVFGGFHRKIKNSTEDLYSGQNSGEDLDKLLYDCISTCKQDARYRNDLRFLKIWFLYVIYYYNPHRFIITLSQVV